MDMGGGCPRKGLRWGWARDKPGLWAAGGGGLEGLAEAGLGGTWSKGENLWLLPMGGTQCPELRPQEDGWAPVQGAEDELEVLGDHSTLSGQCGKVQVVVRPWP